MSELDKIGLVNRGDVIRAIRQVITDAKVDVDAIIRDEVAKVVAKVVAKRVANADLQAPKADGEPIKDNEYLVQRFAGDGPVVVCHGPAFTLRGDDAARWLRLTANSIEHARILGERALSAAAP